MVMAQNDQATEGLDMPLSERMTLQFEVEQFLFYEASLLDSRQFKTWLTLLADDIHYWMPIRRTVTLDNIDREFTKIGDMAYYDDDYNDLKMRVEKFYTGSSWSEDPPSRTRHFVSNVQIVARDGDMVTVHLAFRLYRNRLDNIVDDFVGCREDKLRRSGNSFQIAQRFIYLDQTVIGSTNLSSLF